MIQPPTLTPSERSSLEWVLRPERKGGWHPQSVDSLRVKAMLEAGETRNDGEEELLEHIMSMQDRAGRVE